MRIGFACAWGREPERTWSGTPWGLRNALRRQAEVVDLGVEYSTTRALLNLLYVRRRHGQWASVYRWSSFKYRMLEKKLQASLRKVSVDAVVEISDLAWLDVPFYPYKDLTFAVLKEYYDPVLGGPGGFKGINLDDIKRREEHQHRLWESAAGIFAMSEWIADALVESSGVPRNKVFVVYAGLNSFEETTEDYAELEASVTRREPAKLLFVGRAFFRKGGDTVLEALTQLRREYLPNLQLTVVGPDKWPLDGDVPEGVVFLGSRSPTEVARLYREHDLFVMPSRFEPFGIVFIEALAHGLPVVARSDFAMPEIIEPGRNGALVDSDNPAELASAIVAVLEDHAVREFTARNAKEIRAKYSWEAVAGRMLAAMEGRARSPGAAP